MLSDENMSRVRALSDLARQRGQTLAQMAISWVLRDDRVTSAVMGASRWEQIEEAIGALENTRFSAEELTLIDLHAVEGGLNLWAESSEGG
jgi:L-glyceraldehyde 3-phosphate reductase